MRSGLVTVLLLLSTLACEAQNAAPRSQPIAGVARIKLCSDWARDRRVGPVEWAPDEDWLFGYLSALSERHPMPNFWGSDFWGAPTLKFAEEIDTICTANPQMYLGDAAEAFWIKRGGVIDPVSKRSN